jgi:hypothetical protein
MAGQSTDLGRVHQSEFEAPASGFQHIPDWHRVDAGRFYSQMLDTLISQPLRHAFEFARESAERLALLFECTFDADPDAGDNSVRWMSSPAQRRYSNATSVSFAASQGHLKKTTTFLHVLSATRGEKATILCAPHNNGRYPDQVHERAFRTRLKSDSDRLRPVVTANRQFFSRRATH